jgi:hypothetical protein
MNAGLTGSITTPWRSVVTRCSELDVGSASRPDAAPETTKADIHDETTVAAALFGSYSAVNAVILYVERGGETFDAVLSRQRRAWPASRARAV